MLKGSMLIFTLLCAENHERVRYSQPNLSEMAPEISFSSVTIIFTGNTFQLIKELVDIKNVFFIGHTTFNVIQKKYLFPAIYRRYTNQRQLIIDKAREKRSINLLGERLCDSPSYNANYGTYTVLDENSRLILDFNCSHGRTSGDSVRMELNGVKQILEPLQGQGLRILSLTTDRHYITSVVTCVKRRVK